MNSCEFTNNTAIYRGGAIANYNSNNFPNFTGNSFSDNSAGSGGKAIANDSSVKLTINNIVHYNILSF